MLVNALLDTYSRSPRTLAVADGTRELTYGQLTVFAAVIRDVVRRETRCERVGIMLPASATFPAAFMGTLWLSKVAIPLNFLLGAGALAHIVEDAQLDMIVTTRHFADLANQLPARAVFLEDLPLKSRILFRMIRPLPCAPQVQENQTAAILYTSGTSAEPKGVELSYRNLHSNCVDVIATAGIDHRQRFLNTLPPFHVFGLTANVLVPIVLGAPVYAIPRFSPVAFVKTVAEKRVTVILAIPSMYAAVLRTKSAKSKSLRSVYLAMSGGEPLPDGVRKGFKERFGVTLREGYGLTETSPIVSTCTVASHRDGTVGKPIRNVELRISTSSGGEAPTGEQGEILVRGPGVMKGYYRKPQETRQVLDREGWFRTGDVGSVDDAGFLKITGRVKEMLIIGGENVSPREIESVLESHPEVVQVGVIGMPDELRGEVPVAFVIPARGSTVTEQELRNFAKRSLAGFKVPKRIEIREDLPKGPTGKLLKRHLRELL
ncbi:MAG: AMP-binding protein [Phycisphaerales bacterium]|nr:MAG: AMP-binding protein [Phycisphaerales bacterium]